MCNTELVMANEHNQQVLEKTYRVAKESGLHMGFGEFSQAVFELAQNDTTKSWQEMCTPIENWIRNYPELCWFIDAERVANEGRKTSAEIKETMPTLTKDEFLNKLYEIWHGKLLEFALMHGYCGY